MAWMIGVDEAGYGPNLGPLAVAATAWHVDDCSSSAVDLYDRLEDVVAAEAPPCRVRCADQTRRAAPLVIADSKQLYKPAAGLGQLERGVLATIVGGARNPPEIADWRDLIATLGADPDDRMAELPWHEQYACRVPLKASVEEIAALADSFARGCSAAGVQLHGVRARLVFPEAFNALVERFDTKGGALSHVTLQMVRDLVNELSKSHGDPHSTRANPAATVRGEQHADIAATLYPTTVASSLAAQPISITLDKHGGRNRYAGLLQHHFPESWIAPIVESRAESRYDWEHEGRPIQACFRTRGEAALEAALASMTAKYCRELSMRAWNQFWARHVPGIRPTAGYPVDAKRFRAEIAAAQRSLGIADHTVWRMR